MQSISPLTGHENKGSKNNKALKITTGRLVFGKVVSELSEKF